MRKEELESHAVQIKQTDFSGFRRARMVDFCQNLYKFKNKSLPVSISLKFFCQSCRSLKKKPRMDSRSINLQKVDQTPVSERRETTVIDIIIIIRMMMVTAQLLWWIVNFLGNFLK